MSRRAYRSYQGGRQRGAALPMGLIVLAGSLLFWSLGPLSIRWLAVFFALLGLFLVLWGLSTRCSSGFRRRFRWVLMAALGLGAVLFMGLEGIVLAGDRTEIDNPPDVVVILGAQVKSWGPSVLLADRLDAAFNYLEGHPDLPVIVTGAKGPDEPSTEAAAMRDYLVERGMDASRIWLEEKAHSTMENLQYTRMLLEKEGLDPSQTHLLVVSNGFHLARVRMLAVRLGLDVSTLAAPASHRPSLIQSILREGLALAKSWLMDR